MALANGVALVEAGAGRLRKLRRAAENCPDNGGRDDDLPVGAKDAQVVLQIHAHPPGYRSKIVLAAKAEPSEPICGPVVSG